MYVCRYRGTSFFDDAPKENIFMKQSTYTSSINNNNTSPNKLTAIVEVEPDLVQNDSENLNNKNESVNEVILNNKDQTDNEITKIDEATTLNKEIANDDTKVDESHVEISASKPEDTSLSESVEDTSNITTSKTNGPSWRGSGRKSQNKTRVYVV
jgi:hypothetical protein